MIAGDQVFLGWKRLRAAICKLPAALWSLVDLDQDGRWMGSRLSSHAERGPIHQSGLKNYKWQAIRTRAASVMGDQRINPFGIGGEIEIRVRTPDPETNDYFSGFALWPGRTSGVEFARHRMAEWLNLGFASNQSVLAQQRLKGSCPFLFAWDGTVCGL